jgi:hypothetical protein
MRAERIRRVVVGSRDTVGGTVYGTIVVMGAIAAGSGEAASPGQLAGIAAGTVLVLWVAHVYADALAETIALGRRLDRAEFASVAGRELSIPLAATAPVTALVLGALGVLGQSTALWTAMAFGLMTLLVQGVGYARVERLSKLGTVATVAINLALGLVIVALKAGLGH